MLRGDPSDGLPGVPGVGAKTAAALVNAFGDLAGIRAAAARTVVPRPPLTAAVLKRLHAAAGYLDAAPTVVAVERAIDLPGGRRRAAADPGRPRRAGRARRPARAALVARADRRGTPLAGRRAGRRLTRGR